jgi:site-specific recombinase XerD
MGYPGQYANDGYISQWLEKLVNENKSGDTLKTYLSTMNLFANFFKKDLCTVKREDIGKYLNQKDGDKDKFSVGTKYCRQAALDEFYKWMKEQRMVNENPIEEKFSWKKPDRLPEYWSVQEIRVIKEYLLTKKSERDFIVFQTLIGSGLRIHEVVKLTDKSIFTEFDIDGSMSYLIRVIGKGNKERIVGISKDLYHLLKNYILKFNLTEGPIFLNRFGEQIIPNHYNKLFTEIENTLKIRCHPHMTRHTYAMMFINSMNEKSGGNPRMELLQKQLGHTDPNTTQIYFDLLNKTKSQAAQDFAPSVNL